jgi:hypothetical protein
MGRYLYPTLHVYEVRALTTSDVVNYGTAAVDTDHDAHHDSASCPAEAGTGGWLVKVGSCRIDRALSAAYTYTYTQTHTQSTVPRLHFCKQIRAMSEETR